MTATMEEIAQIGFTDGPRYFTLAEAEELLPLVKRITHEACLELQPLSLRLNNMLASDPRLAAVEYQYDRAVRCWVSKMERLGLLVKGLWLVDFDTGDGCLCWRYPELRIAYHHAYDAGFEGRRPLREIIEEQAPDWA